jgi:hypothetical protein
MRTPLFLLALALLGLLTGCHNLFLRPDFIAETRLETPKFALRTDLSSDARTLLLGAADEMCGELETVYPAADAAEPADRREIVAFADPADFKRFLRSHLFSQERAIGFYCDAGRECALSWRDPPGPEDVRVLRHELVHQHLALRLHGRIPAWLEEGIAEQHALSAKGEQPGWGDYRARRLRADASFAALDVHAGRRSWPEEILAEPPTQLPPPLWAAGEGGYVHHLLFVRFLEAIGEGRKGALGKLVDTAAGGKDAELDLSARFASIGEVEAAFHAYVLHEGHLALRMDRDEGDAMARAHALRRLEALDGSSPKAPAPTKLSMPPRQD